MEKQLRTEVISLIRSFIFLNYPSLSNDIKNRQLTTPREKALYFELDKARAKIADLEIGGQVYERQISSLNKRKDYWQSRCKNMLQFKKRVVK